MKEPESDIEEKYFQTSDDEELDSGNTYLLVNEWMLNSKTCTDHAYLAISYALREQLDSTRKLSINCIHC